MKEEYSNQYRRWYDKDPVLSEAVKTLEETDDQTQIRVALNLIKIIIEHNMDVVKCADYVIDIGPEGGEAGGNIVIAGTPEEVANCPQSHTGQYLNEKLMA